MFEFIANLFKPVSDLVDELHVSDEEKGQLRNELAQIQSDAQAKLIDLEKARLDALSKVQVAESNSKHTITAVWRPISSIMFVIVITLAAFDVIPKPDPEFYELSKIFLGAYVSSRGLEKVASVIKLGK